MIETTKKILSDLNQGIAKRINGKGIANTGNAVSSLRVDSDANSVRAIGTRYIEQLDTGRPPGNLPPITNIQSWVNSKLGISGSEAKSVAFAVGYKIADEGTEIYKDNSKGIQLSELIDEAKDRIRSEVTGAIAQGLRSDLRSINNKLTNAK